MGVYTDETKAKALASIAQSRDLRASSVECGVPISTLREWAKKAGIEWDADRETTAAATAGAATAAALRRNRVDESNERMTLLLATIAELAGRLEITMLRDPERYKVSLRDVVGARTRAIHDQRLITGEATERTETMEIDEVASLRDTLRERLSVVPDESASGDAA